MTKYTLLLIIAFSAFSCSNNDIDKKGFSVSSISEESTEENEQPTGLQKDSAVFETRPQNVLLTAHPEHRLTPLFKVNYNKKTHESFIGSNAFHYRYPDEEEAVENNWNGNLMPGFEGVYGYNLVNVSHFNTASQIQHAFFDKPVLVKTLYYPTFSKDTLNKKPVTRNFYMVSAYDEDTNKDGMINIQDLRRLYYFDLNAVNKRPLVPVNYSVLRSEYDSANDFMYVFAKLDENNNGKCEEKENIHIFWVDLKNPEKTGRQY
jgi:hypothetical protein